MRTGRSPGAHSIKSTVRVQRTAVMAANPEATLDAGTRLVFVGGAPRSGTTWLQRLLASHPLVGTGQESFLMTDYVAPQLRNFDNGLGREERGGLGIANYFDAQEFVARVSGYARELVGSMIATVRADMPDLEVFVEKTPGNALCVPEIRLLFPAAKIILITRNPRDVLASWRRSARTWAPWLNTDPKWVAEMIVSYTNAINRALSSVDAEHLGVIKYEDLYTEPAAALDELGNFIGVPFTSEDIDRALNQASPEAIRTDSGVLLRRYGAAAQQFGPVVHEPEGFIGAARPDGSRRQMSWRDRWWIRRCERHLRRRIRNDG
jgi:hypothetical protein